MKCPICNLEQSLEGELPENKWPRELKYICPNGHRNIICEVTNPRLMPTPKPFDQSTPYKKEYSIPIIQSDNVFLYEMVIPDIPGKFDPKINHYLKVLEKYINGIIIQADRIDSIQNEISFIVNEQNYNQELMLSNDEYRHGKMGRFHILMIQQFLEIHYYFICMDKIKKVVLNCLIPILRKGQSGLEINLWRASVKSVETKFKCAFPKSVPGTEINLNTLMRK